MRKSHWFVGLGLVIAVPLLACSKSVDVGPDVTPPAVAFQLSILENQVACPMSVVFYLNPLACTDNVSSRQDLHGRWDFDNDGNWDTEFEKVQTMVYRDPAVLPVDTWTVRFEVVDQAGNSSIGIESIAVPSWLPRIPDIIAGGVTCYMDVSHTEPVDTVRVGESFDVFVLKQDWVNGASLRVVQRYFIDDVFVGEYFRTSSFCPSQLCCGSWYEIAGGIADVGMHEIRVEVGLADDVAETDLSNNSSVGVLYVVE